MVINNSYADILKQIIQMLLNMLKTEDRDIDVSLKDYKTMIKNAHNIESAEKIKSDLTNFILKYDQYQIKKTQDKEKLIRNNFNLLITIAKNLEESDEWNNNLKKVKDIINDSLELENLNKVKKSLMDAVFETKDTKEAIYKDILDMLFNLLNINSDSNSTKLYSKNIEKLKTELIFKPNMIETIGIRRQIKQLIRKKEELENEYIDSLNVKLSKALQALIYAINTFSQHPTKYTEQFKSHIKEINKISDDLETIDIDEISKRLIGIVMKIKETTILMENELKDYANKIIQATDTIEELRKQLEIANNNLIVDSLTSIYNRRGLTHFLNIETSKAKRYIMDLSIIMADLDHFSNINNKYGHLVGDKVLQKFCEVTKSIIRSSDVLTRYGGEEFIIILPNTHIKNAYIVAEKIRTTISEMKFQYKNEYFNITCSFGVTQFKKTDSIESFINRADNALYSAKKTRNATKEV